MSQGMNEELAEEQKSFLQVEAVAAVERHFDDRGIRSVWTGVRVSNPKSRQCTVDGRVWHGEGDSTIESYVECCVLPPGVDGVATVSVANIHSADTPHGVGRR